MIGLPLPHCASRGAEHPRGLWKCNSRQLVVPGGVVPSQFCAEQCPYVERASRPDSLQPSPRPLRLAVADHTTGSGRSIAGRQLHSLEWAQTLALLGHDVEVFFNSAATEMVTDVARRFEMFWGRNRSVRPAAQLGNTRFDAVLSAGTWIPLPSGTPVISRWIEPHVMPNARAHYGEQMTNQGHPTPWQAYDNLLAIWMQSRTQSRLLSQRFGDPPPDVDTDVFYAPRDYAQLRRAARPWNDRRYDLCFVGRDSRIKRPDFFIRVVRELGLRAAMVLPARRETNVPAEIDLFEAADRKVVAEVLGNSRIFLFAPVCEVCPQTVFEALNAGCLPVTNSNGSMPEQIGACGLLFDDDDFAQAREHVARALADPHEYGNVSERIAQGTQFDRAGALKRIRAQLERIALRV